MANELSKGRGPTVPSLTALAALKTLQSHLATERQEEIPPGYFLARYWATEWRKSFRRTNELLADAIRVGLVDVVPTNKGRVYRFKTESKETNE